MHNPIKHIVLHLICFITISAPQLYSNDTSPQAIFKNHQATILSMIPNNTHQQEILQTKYPLHYACEQTYTDVVKFFIQQNVNIHAVDQDNSTPLVKASHSPCILKMLLMRGADIEARNWSYFNALCYALMERYRASQNLLFSWGAVFEDFPDEAIEPYECIKNGIPQNFSTLPDRTWLF